VADGEDPESRWTGVYCLRPYNPWMVGGVRNPAFVNETDGRLLAFKRGEDWAVEIEADVLARALGQLTCPRNTTVAVVPGHEEADSNLDKPLARVAHILAESDDRLVAWVDTLIRVKTIPKLAKGGDRSVEQHLSSMRVNSPPPGSSTVLVLDDTVSTGNSMTAARALLSRASLAVAAVGLCRTVKYF
jgi:predicted amidophosphoribosyltransferase